MLDNVSHPLTMGKKVSKAVLNVKGEVRAIFLKSIYRTNRDSIQF